MMKHLKYSLFLAFSICLFSACFDDEKQVDNSDNENKEAFDYSKVPSFNEDSALAFVQKQVDFGFRVPNTEGHVACGDWFVERLNAYGAKVLVQPLSIKAFDGKILKGRNIIAQFNPELKKRVFVSAHWDTRPFADQEGINSPIDGANDGASGAAVLIELARILQNNTPKKLGIDLIFFDLEDYGQPENSGFPEMENSYCLGSQYWSRSLKPVGYNAKFGILLDMVGAKDATFTMEGTSMQYAKKYMEKVWNTAHETGYGNYFPKQQTRGIVDDHYYINPITQIPTLDIIHRDMTTDYGFFEHWHKQSDDMEIIDKKTLKAVGQTCLSVLYKESERKL